ncbi:MAG: type II toxin-antitoxin system VapC family toxin [Anaerolineae bacterium]|nr:type II toxin-antitoxin system VapC family toxin [Anaerolineae bacterium]
MAELSAFDCVVDASVGIKLFLVEPLSDRVDVLFDHLADALPARFYVPDLFFVECANILWKYACRFGYPPDAARQDVADLVRLPVRPVSMAVLAEPALVLSIAWQITAYDAVYVTLAGRLSLPLVTADEALVRKLAGSDVDVRFIGDWPAA